jgi:(p)ppGpp synthase/HD superfamily hydrolase
MFYDKALKLAEEAHKNQKRLDSEPYINHCIRVADKVNLEIKSGPRYSDLRDIMRSVAVLHDVMEDTKITLQEIKLELDINNFMFDDCLIRLTRKKGGSYLDYILRIKESYRATVIKLCDLEDNMNSNTPKSLVEKYLMAQYILS